MKRVFTQEWRNKMSEAKKENPVRYWQGKQRSEETKEKIRQSLLGRKNGSPSLETRIKISNANRGEKCANWKGGITPIRLLIWKSMKAINWRNQIFERDQYTCQVCGKKGRLHAHHYLISFSKIITHLEKLVGVENLYEKAMIFEPLWDIRNGQTLCIKCHQETDNYGGASITW